MKLISLAFCLSLAAAVGAGTVAGQSRETVTKEKVKIEDGKDVTLTGCIARAPSGSGFWLTKVADKKTGAQHEYVLVTKDEDVAKNVGHLVEIKGEATDKGDAKVTLERETKTKGGGADEKETKTKSQLEGDLNMPYLGVKSVKLLAAACQ